MLPLPWKKGELQPVTGLRNQINRLFENFFEEWPSLAREEAPLGVFVPTLDLKDTEDALVAELELPGMKQSDIEVKVEDDVLTIRGERTREEEKKARNYYHRECSYGAFERQVALPASVDRDRVEAVYTNGVLRVTLPKVASAKSKVVSIKVK